MSLALALDIPFSNNLVVARHNRHELADTIELAARMGSLGLRFGHLMPSPDTTARDNSSIAPEFDSPALTIKTSAMMTVAG